MYDFYIAGPMTGIPQFNFPAFEAAAAALRARGLSVISPHEQDPPDMQRLAWASKNGNPEEDGITRLETWGQTLGRDVPIIADQVAGIMFLPDWTDSRGARLEAFVGLLCGKTFYTYNHKGGVRRSSTWVAWRLISWLGTL